MTFWVQQALFGPQPLPFRLFNVALHGANAFLLYRLLREILRGNPMGRWAAVGAAALFAIHPSHAEPVQWIASRTDLLATFFGLLSLLSFVRWVRGPFPLGLVGIGLLFLLGLLAKESVLVLPGVVAAYLFCFRPPRVDARAKGALAGVAGVTLVLYLATRLSLMGLGTDDGLVRSGGLKLLGSTVAQVVRSLLPGLPFGDPTLNNAEALRTAPGLVFLGIGLLLLVVLGVRSGKSDAPADVRRFLILSFALSLLPAVGLSVRLFRAQGERFLYLPSAFLLAWVAVVLLDTPAKVRRLPWLGLPFLLLQWQNLLWRDGAELAQRLERSVATDVVPSLGRSTERVVFLNAPVRVHGSYAAFYVLGEIARNHGMPAEIETESLLAMQLIRVPHRVQAEREGPFLVLALPSDAGVFLPEDTFRTQTPSSEMLAAKGVRSVSPNRAEVDLTHFGPGTSVFYWDGERFRPAG